MDQQQQMMLQALMGAGQDVPRMPPPMPMDGAAASQNGLPPPVPMPGAPAGPSMLGMPPPAPMPMKEPYILSPQEQQQWQQYLGAMEK